MTSNILVVGSLAYDDVQTPAEQRTIALSWESNFVKMPKKDSHYPSPAFDEMKSRLTALRNKK